MCRPGAGACTRTTAGRGCGEGAAGDPFPERGVFVNSRELRLNRLAHILRDFCFAG